MRIIQGDFDSGALELGELTKESRTLQLQRKLRQHRVKLHQIIKQTKKLAKANVNLDEVVKELEESPEFKSLSVIRNEKDDMVQCLGL
jgi:hypothetical protein